MPIKRRRLPFLVATFCVGASAASSIPATAQSLKDRVNRVAEAIFGSSTFKAEKYKQVPYEMAVNPNFRDELRYRKFYFQAYYFGLETNLGKNEQVQQHLNLKICEDAARSVCTSKVVVHSLQKDQVFALKRGSKVNVYGNVLEVTGMDIGGSTLHN